MKNLFIRFIITALFICNLFAKNDAKNTRNFTFTYSVNLESSNGEKIELWLPVPQSNKVQNISNLTAYTNKSPIIGCDQGECINAEISDPKNIPSTVEGLDASKQIIINYQNAEKGDSIVKDYDKEREAGKSATGAIGSLSWNRALESLDPDNNLIKLLIDHFEEKDKNKAASGKGKAKTQSFFAKIGMCDMTD